MLLVAPLAGGVLPVTPGGWLALAAGAVTLQKPVVAGSFAHTPFADLNSPLWSISYEFACYLLVPVLVGRCGRRRIGKRGLGVLLAMMLAAMAIPGSFPSLFHLPLFWTVIPTVLDIDRYPISGSNRLDTLGVGDQPVPRNSAGFDNVVVAVPDGGAELVLPQVVPDILHRCLVLGYKAADAAA